MPAKGTLLFIGNYLPVPRYNKNVWHFLAENLSHSGWNVITTSNKENQFLRLMDMLITIWRSRHSYQIAHIDVFSGKALLYAKISTILLRWLKKTIVLTLHGGGLPEYAAKHPRYVRQVLTAADVVVTPSAYHQQAFLHIRSDIKLIANPINLQEAVYRERSVAAPRLIWVRAFHDVYNPDMAIRVLHLLSLEYPEVHLCMLGPDKGDGSLESAMKLSKEFGIESKLQIVGHVTHAEVPRWLDQADIFINTSNYDTAPRSLLEAMANGLCVVSTNVGGIPMMATDKVEAILVDPDDFEAMALAVKHVLDSPDLTNKLNKNARLRAEQSDWSAILPKWDALFSELLQST